METFLLSFKMINIQYKKTNGTYTFSDVIVLENDHTLSDQDIETLKDSRFQNWLTVVSQPVILSDNPDQII